MLAVVGVSTYVAHSAVQQLVEANTFVESDLISWELIYKAPGNASFYDVVVSCAILKVKTLSTSFVRVYVEE